MKEYDLTFSFALNEIGKEWLLMNIPSSVSLANRLDSRLVTFLFHHQSINSVNIDIWFDNSLHGKEVCKCKINTVSTTRMGSTYHKFCLSK
jgi:hypothetical protein